MAFDKAHKRNGLIFRDWFQLTRCFYQHKHDCKILPCPHFLTIQKQFRKRRNYVAIVDAVFFLQRLLASFFALFISSRKVRAAPGPRIFSIFSITSDHQAFASLVPLSRW